MITSYIIFVGEGSCSWTGIYSGHVDKPVRMLVYVTRKPANVLFGLDQETVSDDPVTLLKTISVGGSGPK